MQRHLPDQLVTAKQLSRLAVATALLPILAANLSYLVAIAFDAVPACMPYLEGCTSISSVGRSNPSQWIFKPLMLLSALIMATFFRVSANGRTPRPGRIDAIAACGILGAAALVIYLIFLGSEGSIYRLLRRYGVSLYFGFVFLAQLLLARRIIGRGSARLPARCMLGVSALLLLMGIGSIPVTNFVANKDRIENIIEWNFALLLQVNFLLAWWALKDQDRSAMAKSDQSPARGDER